ncbi:MAG: SpoIIE family protein phosphatase [Acidobacteriota bacterium]
MVESVSPASEAEPVKAEEPHSEATGGPAPSFDAERLQALVESARLLHGSLELDQILGSLLRTVMGRVMVTRGFIALARQPGDPSPAAATVAVSRGLRALPAGHPFDPEEDLGSGIQHLLPIGDSQTPTGWLGLGRPLRGELGAKDRVVLEALLGLAASAIDNARAHRQLDRRLQQLRTLLDLVRSLTAVLEPEAVARTLGLTLAGQFLLRRWVVAAAKGQSEPVLQTRGVQLGWGKPEIRELLGGLTAISEPIAISELGLSESGHPESQGSELQGSASRAEASNEDTEPPRGQLPSLGERLLAAGLELAVPLRSGDTVVGAILLGPPPGNRSFRREDRELLAGIAAQGVVALDNAWNFAEALEMQRLEQDLALAAQIQDHLFPSSLPRAQGLYLAARNIPAQRVGGDYYDALPLEDGGMLFCVADVSGKGVAASLLMSNLQATLRALLTEESDLAQIVARSSQLLFDTTPANKYVTALFVETDAQGRQVRYVNAGHNEGLLVRQDGQVEELGAGGMPVGLFPGASYEARELSLAPGDLLALYSDGVTEANDPEGEEWGGEALREVLIQERSHGADAVVARVFAAVEAFAAGSPQYDDITLLVAEAIDPSDS